SIACFCLKWWTPGNELIGNHRQAIEVTGGSRFASRLFGGDIERRSYHCSRLLRVLITGNHESNAEVSQQQRSLRAQEHIGRFDITMNHPLSVSIVYRFGGLHQEGQCLSIM